MTNGQAIRALRDKRGWTMRQLAERAGSQENAIHLIETGQREPTVATLQRIAAALGTSIDRLLKG